MFKVRKCGFQSKNGDEISFFGIKLDFQTQKCNFRSYTMLECYLGKHFTLQESYKRVTTSSAYKLGLKSPQLKRHKMLPSLCQIGFFDPQNLDFIQNASSGPFGNIMHGIDHENGSINYFKSETGLKQPILAKNASNLGFLEPNLSFRP